MKQGIVCPDIEAVKSHAMHLSAAGINLVEDVRKFSADMTALIDAGANIAAVAGVIAELGKLAGDMTEMVEKAGNDFVAYLEEVQSISNEVIDIVE